jgi:hypothetical protein
MWRCGERPPSRSSPESRKQRARARLLTPRNRGATNELGVQSEEVLEPVLLERHQLAAAETRGGVGGAQFAKSRKRPVRKDLIQEALLVADRHHGPPATIGESVGIAAIRRPPRFEQREPPNPPSKVNGGVSTGNVARAARVATLRASCRGLSTTCARSKAAKVVSADECTRSGPGTTLSGRVR